MKTAWATSPLCEAGALPIRSRNLEPLGTGRVARSCLLAFWFLRSVQAHPSIRALGKRAVSSSPVPPSAPAAEHWASLPGHSASRASFDAQRFNRITPLGSVPARSATRVSCCPQHQAPRLVRRLTRGSCWSRSPESRSTRGVARSTCQERSRRAPPNTLLQRTRYARR
jgi:hypothetical protein